MDIKEKKARLRLMKKVEISELSSEYIKQSDAAIAEKLRSLKEYKNAGVIFAYYSIGREVSTNELISSALRSGRRVALPVSGEAGEMYFRLVSNADELIPGKFGIPEPSSGDITNPKENDIMIVPALCCDRANNRLGHGAGYYDRYLSEHKCFSVCLCRSRLLENSVPAESTDVRVNLVISD